MKHQYRKLELRSNCCRICLEANSELQDLEEISFNNVPAIDALNKMFNFNITPVELLSVDIPRKMCLSCREDVAESVGLWTLAWNTQRKIDELKRGYEEEISKIFNDLSSTSDEDEDSGFSCAIGQDESVKADIEASACCPYACPECKTKFDLFDTLIQHLETHRDVKFDHDKNSSHANRRNENKSLMKGSKGTKICSTCGLTLLTTSFKRHMQLHNPKKEFACTICGFEAPLKDYIQRHLISKHSTKPTENLIVHKKENNPLSTTDNKVQIKPLKTLETKVDVKRHKAKTLTMKPVVKRLDDAQIEQFKSPKMKSMTEIPQKVLVKNPYAKWICDICGKHNAQKSNLEYHLKVHFNILDVPCRFCPKAFRNKYSLATHMHHVHGKTPLKCAVCEATFEHSSQLRRHLNMHARKQTRHKCELCGHISMNKVGLDMHKYSVHKVGGYIKKEAVKEEDVQRKLHECEYCGKAFSKKSNLNRHIRTHTKEKRYSCPECFKTFSTKSVLYTHYRMHTLEKPFECGVCEKRFGRAYHLKRHEMTHR